MADAKIGRAVLEISIDDKQYKVALDQIGKGSAETAKHVKGISQAVNLAVWKELGTMAVGALRSIGGALIDLTQRGAEVEGVSSAFGRLAAGIGETRDSMLDTTRTATKGLISDFDLMAAGNKAMLLGLPVTASSMGTMAQAATVLGRAMKQDAGKSFDDLITALGRSSPMILDNLGLTVKVGDANTAYAQKLGKSVEQLTEAEKKTAFYNAAMEAARKKVEEVGGIHLTLADMVAIAKNQLQNLTDQVGVAVNQSPVLRAGMEAAGKAISEAFGGNQTSAVDQVTGAIENLAILGAKAAQVVVQGAGLMSEAFFATRFALNATLEAVALGVGSVAQFLADFAAKAATAPGILGDAYKPLVGIFQGIADTSKAMAIGFGQVKDQAVQDSNTTATAFGLTEAALGKVITSMEAAKGKARETGQASTGAANAAADQAEKTAKLAAASRTMLEGLATEFGIINDLQMAAMVQFDTAFVTLMQDLTTARQTGLDGQMAAIELQRAKELQGLEMLKLAIPEAYGVIALMVDEKYRGMTASAVESFVQQMEASAQCALTQEEQAQISLDKARANFAALEKAGGATYDQLRRAYGAVKAAEDKVDEESTRAKLARFNELASSASSVLRSMFGKSKAAALAAAIIDTAAAVISSFKNAGGFPWGLIPAAAMAAAGLVQINKIRSTDAGFAEGTPGLDFSNFGRVMMQPLHGQEAVIPRGKGHLLGGEVADELGSRGMGGPGDRLLRRIADAIEAQPQVMARALRDALLMAQ